jgi:AbrB family transcriptional regulator, transcriptional pleiotropic regulator of transition state genes
MSLKISWFYAQNHKLHRKKGGVEMKFTGMVRKVDELGRVVIPIQLRRVLEIKERDTLEIHVDGERIVLKKYDPTCIFTGEADETICYKNKLVSRKCIEEMYALLQNEKAPIE